MIGIWQILGQNQDFKSVIYTLFWHGWFKSTQLKYQSLYLGKLIQY